MVQYSNRPKTCLQSEKDGLILSAKTCHDSEKSDTIFKQSQNLSSVRKRWYNTQTEPKPVTNQKKMVQYSNSAKTCHQSEKDVTILKQCKNLSPARKRCKILKQGQNLSAVRKRWYNSQTVSKPANSPKKMVQYSNRAKTCH